MELKAQEKKWHDFKLNKQCKRKNQSQYVRNNIEMVAGGAVSHIKIFTSSAVVL